MTDRLKDFPVLNRDGSNLKQFADAVREGLQTFRGYRGDPLDQALTKRDAAAGGFLLSAGLGGSGPTGPQGIQGPVGPAGTPYTPDLTPPPTPTGLVVTAGLSYLYIEHDNPTYTQGHGHDRTIVYGAKWPTGGALPTFSGAVRLCDFQGTIGAYPTEPATRWRIWIKWQSLDGVQSTSPAGGANGVLATTGQDVSALLAALTGQITESQLFSTLGARINLIDGADSLPGSVAARVLAEAVARGTAITSEATTRASADSALASNITTLTASVGTNAAAISSEATARASADSALSSTISTVAATAATNTAAITSEATARAASDSALSSSITTLTSSINTAGGNRLRNSSFEVESATSGRAKGWNGYNNSLGVEPSTLTLVAGRLGGLAQRHAWTGSNTTTKGVVCAATIDASDGGGGVINGWKSGTTYVVSWHARSSATVASGMFLGFNVGPSASLPLVNPTVETYWQRWSTRITWGGSVESNGTMYLYITGAASGYIDIDDVQVQEGDLLTGYSPGDQAELIASVQTEATARASADGTLFAQYTVKIDTNGYVSGFGLASTSTTAAPVSSFIVRADSFSVASPSGPSISPAVPFIVRTTSGTVNGVLYPAGVYIDAAYILDLTAAVARLGTAWIDDAKIANLSAAKLTVGTGVIGGDLKSSNYVNGVSGWIVRPSGYAEFDFASIRSVLQAGQIAANYITTTMLNAGAVTAAKINVTQLSAITADVGLLRTATSGARMEISGPRIEVYDSANVLRVKIGVY